MDTPFIQRLLIQYPEWHKHSFRLSMEEIENPHLVLEEFFACYNLINVRACLWNWLHDAMHRHQPRATDLLYIYEKVEKLIEAAWILHLEKTKREELEHSR